MKHDMERELLEWKKGMLELRRKYRDTPPGFQDDRTEQAYLCLLYTSPSPRDCS